jgi:hypothetical protein
MPEEIGVGMERPDPLTMSKCWETKFGLPVPMSCTDPRFSVLEGHQKMMRKRLSTDMDVFRVGSDGQLTPITVGKDGFTSDGRGVCC